MAKGIYVGVGNVAKKVKSAYIGVDGVARKIKKAYIGVGGVARLIYSSEATKSITQRGFFLSFSFDGIKASQFIQLNIKGSFNGQSSFSKTYTKYAINEEFYIVSDGVASAGLVNITGNFTNSKYIVTFTSDNNSVLFDVTCTLTYTP